MIIGGWKATTHIPFKAMLSFGKAASYNIATKTVAFLVSITETRSYSLHTQNPPIMAFSTGEGGFERALARFMKRLTPAEKDQFRFSRLEDVHDVIHDIQESQGSESNMRNLARIQAFVEAMEQYGKIVEVFLNAAELLAFIWVRNHLLIPHPS